MSQRSEGAQPALTQGMRRAVAEHDTVIVRDERGVIVVETVVEWGRSRQRTNVPDGWTVEHKKPERPQGGEEG